MPQFKVYSPTGHVLRVDAPDGATEADAIQYVVDRMNAGANPDDPVDWVPDASAFRELGGDLPVRIGKSIADVGAATIDAAVPDPVAISEQAPVRQRLQLFGKGLSSAGDATSGAGGALLNVAGAGVQFASEAPDRLRDLVAGVSRFGDTVADFVLGERTTDAERAAVSERLTGKPSGLAAFDNERANDRSAEDARRAAVGAPTLEQERRQQFSTRASEAISRASDAIGEALISDEGKAKEDRITRAAQHGARVLFGELSSHPIDAALVLAPSSAGFLLPEAAVGRLAGATALARGIGAERAAQVASNAGLGAAVATQAVQDAQESARQVMSLTERQGFEIPDYQELRAQGLTHEQALAELATRGYMTTLTSVGALTGLSAGVAQKLHLNVVNDFLTGKAPSVASLERLAGIPLLQRAAQAAVGAGKEGIEEFADSSTEKLGQNIGEVASGQRQAQDIGEGVVSAGLLGTIAAAPLGGGIGATARPESPGERKARIILENAKERADSRAVPTTDTAPPEPAPVDAQLEAPAAAAVTQPDPPIQFEQSDAAPPQVEARVNAALDGVAMAPQQAVVQQVVPATFAQHEVVASTEPILPSHDVSAIDTLPRGKSVSMQAGGGSITVRAKGGGRFLVRTDTGGLVSTVPSMSLAETKAYIASVSEAPAVAVETGEAPDAGLAPKVVETKIEPTNRTDRLPAELSKASPRFGFGDKQFEPTFESDVDRAAFISAQDKPSKRDADFVKFAMGATGLSAAQVREHGAKVRSAIEVLARSSKPGRLVIKRQPIDASGSTRSGATGSSVDGSLTPKAVKALAPARSASGRSTSPDPSRLSTRPIAQRDSRGRPMRVLAYRDGVDDLITYVASHGGIKPEVAREAGIDPDLYRGRKNVLLPGVPNGRIVRQDGMSADALRELLQQDGFLPRDNDTDVSTVSDNDALDLLLNAANGHPVFSETGHETAAQRKIDRYEQEESALAEAQAATILQSKRALQPDVAAAERLVRDIPDFVTREDEAGALTVAELAAKAYRLGATESQINDAAIDPVDLLTPATAPVLARNLFRLIAKLEKENGTDNRAVEAGDARRDTGATREGRPEQATGPVDTATEPADQADEDQLGLFAPPTSEDTNRAAIAAKDAARNGLGRDVVRPEQGPGELLAGPRPEQAEIPERQEKPSDPVQAIVQRFGGSVLAQTVAENFQLRHGSQVQGLTARTDEDLAAANAINRDPTIETLRYQFIDEDGLIVHEVAVSSRSTSSVKAFPGASSRAYTVALLRKVRESHPTARMWMVHNHPSGKPTPSDADIALTKAVAKALDDAGMRGGLAGHVVLDHDTYGSISAAGVPAVKSLPSAKSGGDPTRRPRGEYKHLLGVRIKDAIYATDGGIGLMADIAKVADTARKEDGGVATFVVTDAQNRITAMFAAPLAQASGRRALAALARAVRMSGGSRVSVVASEATLRDSADAVNGIKKANLLRAAVDSDGTASESDASERDRRAGRRSVVTTDTVNAPKASEGADELFAEETGDEQLESAISRNLFAPVTSKLKAAAASLADSYTFAHLDQFIDLERAQERASALLGASLPAWADAWRHENRIHGVAGDQRRQAERKYIKPAIEAFTKVGADAKSFGRYLWWRHAGEREDYLSSRYGKFDVKAKDPATGEWFTISSGGTRAIAEDHLKRATDELWEARIEENTSLPDRKPGDFAGISPEDAKTRIDELPAHVREAFEEAARHMDAMRKFTLDVLKDSGQISAERHQALMQQYKHYAPLRGMDGVEDDISHGQIASGRGLQAQRNPLGKRATGRKTEPQDVMEHMVRDMENAIVGRQKQAFMRTLLNLMSLLPQGELGRIRPMRYAPKWVGGVLTYEWQRDAKIENQMTYMHNGKPIALEVTNDRLARAMKNVGEEQIGPILRRLGGITRFLGRVKTAYSPFFPIKNTPRDFELALAALDAEHPALKGEFSKQYLKTFRVLWDQTRNDPEGTGDKEVAKYEREFSANGGRTSTIFVSDIAEHRNELKKLVHRYSKSPSPDRIATVFDKVMGFAESINESTENAARLAAYIAARKNDMSIADSVDLAKNLTVNFNRRGFLSKHVNLAYMFWNAANRGAATIGGLLKSRRFRRAMYAIGSFSYAMALAQMVALGDDDDGESLYDKAVGDNANKRAIPFMLDGKRHFDLPIFYGANIFSYLGYRAAKMTYDGMRGRRVNVADAAVDVAKNSVDAISPIQTDAGFLSLLPEVGRLAYQLAANSDAQGGKLSYGVDPFEKDKTAARWKDTIDSTNPIYKWIARALNEATTVRDGDYYAGLVNPTGEEVGFIVDEVAGGPGQFIGAVSKLFMDVSAGINPEGPEDIPLFGSLFKGRREEKATGRVFRDRSEEYNSAVAKYVDAVRVNDTEMQGKLLDEEPWLHGADADAGTRRGQRQQRGTVMEVQRDTSRKIKEFRDEQKAIRQDDTIGRKDRELQLRALDAQIAEEQKKFVAALNRARGFDIGDGSRPTHERRHHRTRG